ncbi:hypothetical protein PO587_21520 [Streptomyces gilvifuscus]|uniref:Uncharacterized protein n=1 Tax=Streptomyces gilvifuscus TaxID=1550617 RepID=A0ABT5FWY6_9ACTN|nr:hypothetical protein [Streptomyces gilvifuscus]MDC2957045.1 hypothetical protein [Streptomyces gilvifuscus]
MAKESVTVCLPPCAPQDVHRAVGAAMAPYDYNGEPVPGGPEVETWWDYWFIGVRGAEFQVVPGGEHDPRLVRGTETFSGQPRVVPPALCDGGPRGLLDLEAPRARAAARARRAFEAWRDFSAAHPPARPSSHFRALHLADPEGYPWARALEDYRTQPAVVALLDDPELEELIGGDPADRLTGDPEAHARAAADEALPTHGLLTLDGRWLSIGCAETRRHFNEYLDALPDDALVVRVAYHG